MTLGFSVDVNKCMGCKTCQIACKDINNLDVGILFRSVRTFEVGIYPNATIYCYPSTCNHCKDPKCVEGCPTLAMHVAEDGTVQHDKKRCIGCRYCVWNCPYGVPQYFPDLGIVGKCDTCKDLRDKGVNPACVDACLMRCIEFGDMEALAKKHEGKKLISDLPILPDAGITNPSLLIVPKNASLRKDYKQKKL